MKKVFAEELKFGDIIIIPASTQTNEKRIRVITEPELNELTVNGLGVRIKNGVSQENSTPFQFGRKVDLDIIPYTK